MDRLTELRQALGRAVDKLNMPAIVADPAQFEAVELEVTNLEAEIGRAQRAQERAASLARPVNAPGAEGATDVLEARSVATMFGLAKQAQAHGRREGRKIDFDDCLSIARKGLNLTIDRTKAFSSLGEQLQAIAQHYNSKGAATDPRLVRAPTEFTRAPSGMGEVDPTGGGFLVQVDFAASIFMLAHDMGEILQRVNKIPISANANGLKVPGVDESSRATGSRWGGVSSQWGAEGTAVTDSAPKFRLVEFDLKKLISRATVTDELLADQTALTAILGMAFSEEVMFMTEDAIFEGTGAGMPLGVLNCDALVKIAKENGQAAATIVKENIDKMWQACWGRSRKNAVWLYNQDVESQLAALNGPVGTGGELVYMPPGGISAAPYASLKGRPIIPTEYNSALGAVGDIALVDLSQYTMVDKNGVQMASSMHVAFDTDQMRFRVTYRVDGKPMWHKPLAPFKGSTTRSPFVALAAR
ncbi:phage major capsid protein [Bradyrhizobium sp. SRS-191]|uniref:phage major capsid protein n=1 Tax=Bradyrhizobium sp. SRS-191 TaxID=2962606 RepID=UPI00211DA4A4|nr:phage major capsid protein [Bradyrhizobium sp. SRS-191]